MAYKIVASSLEEKSIIVTREKDQQYIFEDSSLKAFCTYSGDCSGNLQRLSSQITAI